MNVRRRFPSFAAITAVAALACGARPSAAACLGTMSVSASTLDFGNYNPLDPLARDATSTVTVTCNLIAGLGLLPVFSVSLSAGSGSFTTRTLANGAPKLNYNIYTDFARSIVWGNGSSSTVTQSYGALLSLGTVNFTAYGRIFAGQDRPAGNYGDTITVQVDF